MRDELIRRKNSCTICTVAEPLLIALLQDGAVTEHDFISGKVAAVAEKNK